MHALWISSFHGRQSKRYFHTCQVYFTEIKYKLYLNNYENIEINDILSQKHHYVSFIECHELSIKCHYCNKILYISINAMRWLILTGA